MADPLSEVVHLLRPRAVFANVISGKGDWAVRYAEYGRPSFCIMLAGACQLAIDGHAPFGIGAGDFILLPTTPAFTLSSSNAPTPVMHDPNALPTDGSEVRHGERDGPPDMRSLGGAFLFDSMDPALLISLLPAVVHVRGSTRLTQLVQMVAEETITPRPGGDFILSRLVELLLVEAMRSTSTSDAPPGLLKGLGDERLAPALKQMHAISHIPGRSNNSPALPRCRARHSTNASRVPWASHRWNTCWHGGWRSPGTCCDREN
jgi:hypothetical protein